MGTLRYGEARVGVPIDDRALAHLKVVIIAKLRRDESFAFSWQLPEGQGRATAWLHPAIPLMFEFDGSRAPALNKDWLEELAVAANSNTGLSLTPEPSGAAAPPVKESA
jgi:hypothetical protein